MKGRSALFFAFGLVLAMVPGCDNPVSPVKMYNITYEVFVSNIHQPLNPGVLTIGYATIGHPLVSLSLSTGVVNHAKSWTTTVVLPQTTQAVLTIGGTTGNDQVQVVLNIRVNAAAAPAATHTFTSEPDGDTGAYYFPNTGQITYDLPE